MRPGEPSTKRKHERLTGPERALIVELYVKHGIGPDNLAERFGQRRQTITAILQESDAFVPRRDFNAAMPARARLA